MAVALRVEGVLAPGAGAFQPTAVRFFRQVNSSFFLTALASPFLAGYTGEVLWVL